jgi:hypothetical protein
LALLSLIALLLAASVEVRAQEDPSPTPTPPPAPEGAPTPAPPREKLSVRVFDALRREARRYASDSVALVKAPAGWNKTECERMGGCALPVGGLMFFDKDVDRAAQKQRSHFTDRLSGVTAALGDQYGFHVSGALLIAGALFNHENMRESGRDAIEAGVLAYVFDTLVIKRAVGRERPFESNGRTVFVPGSSHDSFPSGHATEAFAVASVSPRGRKAGSSRSSPTLRRPSSRSTASTRATTSRATSWREHSWVPPSVTSSSTATEKRKRAFCPRSICSSSLSDTDWRRGSCTNRFRFQVSSFRNTRPSILNPET